MDDGNFRLGLVGAGRMGRAHLEALAGSEVISVAGVAEPSEAARADLPSSIPTYAGLDEMLVAGGLDGVLVAAPTDLHKGIVLHLVAAGIPVLCEKPCGLRSQDTRECAVAAAEAGGVLQIAYWRRFVPELQALRERIAAGELGEILAVNCYQWDESPPPAGFRHRSGGIFVDMGVHELDQIRWLTGQDFETVSVAAARTAGAEAGDPDCGQLVAELSGGATALVSLGRFHPAGDSCKVEIFGTAGAASSWFLQPGAGDAVFRGALLRQAEHFAAAASGAERGGAATVTDAAAALEVAEAAAARRSVGAGRR